jgi:predicted Zn-dependent protease
MRSSFLFIIGAWSLLLANAHGQSAAAVPEPAVSARQGIGWAEKGRCGEALPLLKKSIARLADKQLRYQASMAITRCAMSVNDMESAVQSLLLLRREFPGDPQVLYITTHYYSELANRTSQELVAVAKDSYQAHELEAEAFESQQRWDEATAEYKKILDKDPKLAGIHFRLARILLAKSDSGPTAEEAKLELAAELKIDPSNASAEFMLGELARRAAQWDEAASHFSRASKLDAGFSEAYLALGMSLGSSGKFSESIAPLEAYVKMTPADPAGHYQLAMAYSKTGRKADAEREMTRQRETAGQNSSGPR